jgi:hypothetical protein
MTMTKLTTTQPHASLRQYINSLPSNPFPRQSTLQDQFFDFKVKDVLNMSEAELKKQLGYVVGMGEVSRNKFLAILEDIRSANVMS